MYNILRSGLPVLLLMVLSRKGSLPKTSQAGFCSGKHKEKSNPNTELHSQVLQLTKLSSHLSVLISILISKFAFISVIQTVLTISLNLYLCKKPARLALYDTTVLIYGNMHDPSCFQGCLLLFVTCEISFKKLVLRRMNITLI